MAVQWHYVRCTAVKKLATIDQRYDHARIPSGICPGQATKRHPRRRIVEV